MRVIKTTAPGVVVRTLTPAELYACVHYALGIRDHFDLKTIGCEFDHLMKYVTPGYNALIDEGVFDIDDETGIPVLAISAEPDVISFIDALSTAQEVLIIVVKLGKKSFKMHYVFNDRSWAFFWKAKGDPNAKTDKSQDKWFIAAGTSIATPWLTFDNLTLNARSNVAPNRKLTIQMAWVDVLDHTHVLHKTALTSKRTGWYEESTPSDISLVNPADNSRQWPKTYVGDALLLKRIEFLLAVI